MSLYTDAAGGIGFGGYFNGKWFQGRWPVQMQLNKDWGISIVVACVLSFRHFSGKPIKFWCNNKSVVTILNLGHSRARCIMDHLWFLVLISMKHIRVCRVPGIFNEIADALSCFQVSRFLASAPTDGQLLIPSHFAHDPLKEEVSKYAS